MKISRPSHATVVAYLALFAAMTGTAAAATGGTFVLGRSNSATTTTSLTNSNGTPLALGARSGTAPLAVSSKVRVTNLNGDLLDGLDSTALQRKLQADCPADQLLYGLAQDGTAKCRTAPAGPAGPAGGWNGSKLYQVTQTIVGNGDNATGYAWAKCTSIGDTVISGGWLSTWQGKVVVRGDFPSSYVTKTADHEVGWQVMYQGLPANETLSAIAICARP